MAPAIFLHDPDEPGDHYGSNTKEYGYAVQ